MTAAATVAIAWLTFSLSTDSTRQADTANQQFQVMKSQLAVMKQQIVARLAFSFNREPVHGGWHLTPTWRNTGQSDAKDYVGWDELRLFKTKEASSFNFLKGPPRTDFVPITISPGDSVSQQTKVVTVQQAQAVMADGDNILVMWGYIEWRDVFDEDPISKRYWCYRFGFDKNDAGNLALELPSYYKDNCNRSN